MADHDNADGLDGGVKSSEAKNAKTGTVAGKRRKRRVWRWFLLFLVISLLIVVYFAPYLLSTERGLRAALGAWNGPGRARIEVEDASLTWLGPIEVRGLAVADEAGREVARVDEVRWSEGLWRAATKPANFGDLAIEDCSAVVYASEKDQGDDSKKDKDKDKSKSGDGDVFSRLVKLRPRGTLTVKGAELRFVNADGKTLRIPKLDAAVEADGLEEIAGSVTVETAEAGHVETHFEVTGLSKGGNFTPDAVVGSARIVTVKPVALGPWATWVGGEVPTDATGKIDVTVEFKDGRVDSEGTVAGLGSELTAKTSLGELEKFRAITAAGLMEAALEGSQAGLPDFVCAVDGHVDLPSVGQAWPGLLHVRPDVTITTGRLAITGVEARGGTTPRVHGDIVLRDLAARKQQPVQAGTQESGGVSERMITFEPILGSFDVGLVAGEGLQVKLAEIKSEFAELTAAGTRSDIKGAFKADLGKLAGRVGEIVDLGKLGLSGSVVGDFAVGAAEKDTLQLAFKMTGRDVLYKAGGQAFSGERLEVNYVGTLSRQADGRWQDVQSEGTAQAENLVMDLGEHSIVEKQVLIDQRSEIDLSGERIKIANARLVSETLTAEAKGTVERYGSDCALDLSGHYKGDAERLTKVLHQLSPESVTVVSLSGGTEGEFSVVGPLGSKDGGRGLEKLRSRVIAGVDGGELYGMEMGKSRFVWDLRDGQARLSEPSLIPLSGGEVRLADVAVDLRGETAELGVPGTLEVMKDVQINAEFAREMLGRVNPMFSSVAEVDGKVSARLEDIDLPLSGAKLKQAGTGRGHIDLGQMRFKPGKGLLQELTGLMGLAGDKWQAMKVSGLDFTIDRGRVWYRNLRVNFSELYELRFYGSVGFDDTVDLVVSLPVTVPLLEKLNVKGPLGRFCFCVDRDESGYSGAGDTIQCVVGLFGCECGGYDSACGGGASGRWDFQSQERAAFGARGAGS